MVETGIILIVVAAFLSAVVATVACIWFGRFLWKEGDRIPGMAFFTLGIILALVISGLVLIALEKGL